jgi:uncharacterized DUF497 family protein
MTPNNAFERTAASALRLLAVPSSLRSSATALLAVFFVYKPTTKTAIIISARDMSARERKPYGQK